MAITMSAQTFTIGGCGHKIATGNGYGSDSPGEIAAALFIPANRLRSLAGNEISRIDVGLISRINVREVTVWVRKSLEGENLASGTIERGKLGWNEVALDNPYSIEKDCPGLYIGFSYNNTGSSHPVSIIGEAGDFTTWLKSTAEGQWEDKTSRGVLSIEAIVTGSHLPKYNLTLDRAEISPDPAGGETCYIVSGTVSNVALEKISGFGLAATDRNGNKAATHVSLEIEPGKTLPFRAVLQSESKFSGPVAVAVETLDEGDDADMADNSVEVPIVFTRNVLIEEFTTERCPNCPEGARMVHEVLEDSFYASHVVAVCHHSSVGTDFLTRDCDLELLWMYGPSGQVYAPAAMFNRLPIFRKGLTMDHEEPIVALRSEDDIRECIDKAFSIPAHAMVGISIMGERKSEAAATVEVKVTVIADSEFGAENPHLVFYTVEDNVKGRNQEGATGDYMHQHVIRTDNGAWGEEIGLDEGIGSHTFTIDLDPSWDKENISFVAFVANRDPENPDNNIVENVASVCYRDNAPSLEMEVQQSGSVAVRGYYDIHGQSVGPDAKGFCVIVYDDGTSRKIMNK